MRTRQGLTGVELSEKLDDLLGDGIPKNAVSLIETGKRRVDVDELVALAVALDVSPVALLMPTVDDGQDSPVAPITLTEELEQVPAHRTWDWLTGEAPLPGGAAARAEAETADLPATLRGVSLREIRRRWRGGFFPRWVPVERPGDVDLSTSGTSADQEA